MSFKLNKGQSEGIKKAINWFFDPNKKPLFLLCGFAGTGKSSCVNLLVELLGINKYQVLYCGLTGKAVAVLRSKNCYANTIHSTFYRVCVDPLTGQTFFAKRHSLNGCIKLIVIDEVSMVDGKMMEDILSFGVPVLALGDPGQLPPLFNPNPYINNPDVLLTEVMRQKGTSGILELATMSRNEEPIPYGQYIESNVIHIDEIRNIEKYDMVLCWSNKRRREINKEIRNKLGHDKISRYPLKGEKIVCFRNNLNDEIIYNDTTINPVNGMLMYMQQDHVDYDKHSDFIDITCRPDFIDVDLNFNLRSPKSMFDRYYNGKEIDNTEIDLFSIPKEYTVFDYGYCFSVHKSQGSQWDNVLFIDDYKGRRDQKSKFLYTAITRAVKRITVACG